MTSSMCVIDNQNPCTESTTDVSYMNVFDTFALG